MKKEVAIEKPLHSDNEWGISLELDSEPPAVIVSEQKTVDSTQQSLSELMHSMKSL